MKSALLLAVTLVGLVAVQGHWERNKQYKYEVKVKALIPSYDSRDDKTAELYYRLHLKLRPQSDDVIIGKITQAEFARAKSQQQRYGDENRSESYEKNHGNFEDTLMSKPFKINLRNGVIKSLDVDRSMSKFEVNQLKLIMSQFQVDTNGQNAHSRNVNPRYENQVRDENNDRTAFYTVMEPTASGQCETMYEINRIPDYLIRLHPEWVPLSEHKFRNEGVAEILKTKNSANCNGRRYILDAASDILKERGVRSNDVSIVETQRIVVSGEVDHFIIQSSRTSNKLMYTRRNTPLVSIYVNTTLKSMEPVSDRSTPDLPTNLKTLEDLFFDFDYKMEYNQYQPPHQPRMLLKNDDPEYRWTTCYSLYIDETKVCEIDLGEGWKRSADMQREQCGFLNLGIRYKCEHDSKSGINKDRYKSLDEMDETFAEPAGY